MARSFVAASSQYMAMAVTPATAAPVTISYWFKSNTATVAQTGVCLYNSASVANRIICGIRGDLAGDPVRLYVESSTASDGVNSATGYTAGRWHHYCGVLTSASARTVYLDGGGAASGTATITMSGVDSVVVGCAANNSGRSVYMDGALAELGIWSIALGTREIAKLANGARPCMVRSDALNAYWPLHSWNDPEPSMLGAYPLTNHGSTASNHAPVRALWTPRRTWFLGAAAGGFQPAWARGSNILIGAGA